MHSAVISILGPLKSTIETVWNDIRQLVVETNPFPVLSCACRSRDRPILVRGSWGETHRPLRQEAQQCGASHQWGEAVSRQDAGDAAQQPRGQEEPGKHPGRGGQGLVTVTSRTPHCHRGICACVRVCYFLFIFFLNINQLNVPFLPLPISLCALWGLVRTFEEMCL